jgi:hypothetical protein
LKDGHNHGFINFLGVLAYIYIAFLDIWMFKFKFELWVHQIHFKLFGGKYLEVWNPRNHACHTWAHHPPWHTQCPPSSWPTFEVLPKVAKKSKTWHGLMICDVYTQSMQRLAYEGFGSWVLHNQVPPKTWRRLACLIIWPRWIDEDGFNNEHSEFSNLDLSQITKHLVMKRWSNGCHWAIGFAPMITIGR